MKYVTITVNNQTTSLQETSDGTWQVVNTAPTVPGEYPVTLTFTKDSGYAVSITSNDSGLANSLLLIVMGSETEHGQQMLDYYPEIIKVITEFQALMRTEGFEIDLLHDNLDFVYDDAFLNTMSESRVMEWEESLNINPLSTDSLEQRRDDVIAKLRGTNKLNTQSIAEIVQAYTQGTCTSHLEDGVLTVEIKPPAENKEFRFSAIEAELSKRIPAHIKLNVIRDYATWGDIKTNFSSWTAISERDDWFDVKAYVAPN